MAIDLATHTLCSFAQGARHLDQMRARLEKQLADIGETPDKSSRKISPSTLWRWFRTGCRSVNGEVIRLEAIKLGGRYLTSIQALQLFSDRLSGNAPAAEIQETAEQEASHGRTPTQREKAADKAERQLEKLGI